MSASVPATSTAPADRLQDENTNTQNQLQTTKQISTDNRYTRTSTRRAPIQKYLGQQEELGKERNKK
jgi:hypothetical protein